MIEIKLFSKIKIEGIVKRELMGVKWTVIVLGSKVYNTWDLTLVWLDIKLKREDKDSFNWVITNGDPLMAETKVFKLVSLKVD